MKLNHIHLEVRDLTGALAWLARVWEVKPAFQNERMATVPFDSLILILDRADQDTRATVGFESDDCDRDYQRVVQRGAVSLEEPTDRPWGVRAAYLQGPGALRFEIEGPLRGKQ